MHSAITYFLFRFCRGTEIVKGDHFWLPKLVRGTGCGGGTEIFIIGPHLGIINT